GIVRLGSVACSSWQSFLQERPYATAYWPFSVRESCTSNANPPNDEILSFRNLSEKTETAPPSFPQKRESKSVGTETYRENGFFRFYVLDSRFCGNDGI
ncbi:hypothetical protein M5Z67_10890, partial [Neisseria meningitidis]|nr:hypothetical protein [Neisseria meningitidis]